MKRFGISFITAELAGLLALSFGCSSSAPTPAPEPIDVASVTTKVEEIKYTPREILNQYKLEQREVLSNSLLQPQGIEALFSGLPKTIKYHDKRTGAFVSVEPTSYLFDLRGVDTPKGTTSSFMAYFDDSWEYHTALSPINIPDALPIYKKNVSQKAAELGLNREYDVVLLQSRPLLPLYEIVQNPSEKDLERLYDALARVPSFIEKPFVKKSLASDFVHADALFAQEPELYVAKLSHSFPYTDCEGCQTLSIVPANFSEPITTSRYENGELRIPERAYGEAIQDNLIFPPSLESKTSPLTKFLYRRGPRFTHDFKAILDAYVGCFDKEDFIQKAQKGLLAAQQPQE